MRYSKQRELILNALKNNPVHPTADYIYALLKKENPALSLGTVYRNLKLLADDGTIKRLKGLDNSERFDHNTFNHCHFICQKCGAIHDIMLPQEIYKDFEESKNNKDYHVNACEIILRGVCKNCKETSGDK